MVIEQTLANYVLETRFEDLPERVIEIARRVILTIAGTTIAGARAEGCEALARQVRTWGGAGEASVLVHGGMVPAHNAAFVNAAMGRALDYCDGMTPGLHLAASSVAAALAAAELAGGCSGKEFLAALAAGMEFASRLNTVSVYDGFDPTGVCGVFAPAAVAGRILGLDARQMVDALALAFNKAGGSMQSNIDGSLAVRVIQGFAAQSGIVCAQLARAGITGPRNFIEGIYGYLHLYAKDRCDRETLTAGLGTDFHLDKLLFKKYPSCGGTLAPTDAILGLMGEKGFAASDVARVDVTVSPHVHKLVGQPFSIGENPKVNAQFNIRYCVANALLAGGSRLRHFDEAYIRQPQILELTRVVHVEPDQSLDDPANARFSIGARVKVTTRTGQEFRATLERPRGDPGNPMSREEHLQHFFDCVDYGGNPLAAENVGKIPAMIERLEHAEDVRALIPLMLANR
ncbi:MAG: MmgE/PrpD family protein, partial [Burkholderiales bacterium]|nr:MmgE/PrpD family protein [Burkholderiales bacterium]